MQNYKHLGFEETTSREFTGWEGRGAMGGCADLQVHVRMGCEYEDGGVNMRMVV